MNEVFTVVGNNVNTRNKPEKFDRKLKLVNTQGNTIETWRFFTISLVVTLPDHFRLLYFEEKRTEATDCLWRLL